MDELHARLTAAGVTLFDAPEGPVVALDAKALADLVVDILEEGSASLAVSIPCLLVAQDRHAGAAIAMAARHLPPPSIRQLGIHYRMARSLARSRGPDIRHLLGHGVVLPPWSGEPRGLPDPDERFGDDCIREATDHETNPEVAPIAGDAERAFDQWLRILAVEGARN